VHFWTYIFGQEKVCPTFFCQQKIGWTIFPPASPLYDATVHSLQRKTSSTGRSETELPGHYSPIKDGAKSLF